MTDDVRVTLSADGVAQVVSAFRSVASEAQKASKESSGAFSELGDEIKGVGVELLGFLAIGTLFEKFKDEIGSIFEGADKIEAFANATGLSTDAVQGLMAAADKAHVPLDAMEASINRLTLSIGKAQTGAKGTLQPFDELGIDFANFKKLAPEQQFELVAKKLAAIKDPATQAAIGNQLFGKSFAEIKPVLDEVANKGLGSYIEHMRELGVLLDGDTLASMKHVNEQLDDLGQQAKGMTTQFLSGMVPALAQGMDSFLKSANDGTDGIKSVGEGVGAVFKSLVLVAIVVGKTIGDVIGAAVQSTGAYITATTGALVKLTTGDFSGAGKSLYLGFKENSVNIKQLLSSVKKDAEDATNSLFGPPTPTTPTKKKGTTGGGGDGDLDVDQLKALAQARYQVISAQLDSELALYEAHATLLQTQDKQQYDAGKLTLQQYYADRTKIISDQFDKEVQILQRKRAAAAAVPTSLNDGAAQLQQEAQLAQIDGQIALKRAQRAQALTQNTQEQSAAQRQLYNDQLTAEARLAQLQGQRYAASKANLEIQLAQLDEVLKKAGTAEDVREQALATARSQGMALADFTEQSMAADAAMKSLDTGVASIQSQVANGQLFPIEGEQKIMDLEKQRLPVLQQIAAAQLAAAQASKDPQAIATAEAFQQKLQDVATATDLAGQRMAEFKAGAQDALQNGLADWLTDGIEQAHNLSQAFKSLVVDVLKGIGQIAAKLAAQAAVQAIIGAFTSSAGNGGGSDQTGGGLFTNAKGNAFDHGSVVTAFASGGAFTNSIASRPTIAPMAMFGEAGPEAIMPLTRASDGSLGVRAQGGSGGDINISTQVNVDGNGNATSSTAGAPHDALMKQFGDLMTQKAKETVVNEMRSGGLLWKWRNGQV
jgi:phage-related minor tail protein